MQPMFSLLSYRELAHATSVNAGTLKRWRHEGMPAQVRGPHVLFDLNEVQAWIDKRRSEPNKHRRLRNCTFNRRSFIYFGMAADRVKIGWTSDPDRRAYEVDIKLLAMVSGGKPLEAMFHRAFASDHIEGEWFRPSNGLMAFIKLIAEEP